MCFVNWIRFNWQQLFKIMFFRNYIYWIIIKLYDNVCGYNILPKFVNQLITWSIQIIQIDGRHLLSYYMPISLVYYYTGVFCDIWTLFFLSSIYFSATMISYDVPMLVHLSAYLFIVGPSICLSVHSWSIYLPICS